MESNPNFYKVAQANAFTVEAVTQKFTVEAPKAANFGFQVGIFFFAVILAITFIQFLLNKD